MKTSMFHRTSPALYLVWLCALFGAQFTRAQGPFALSFDGTNDYVFMDDGQVKNVFNVAALTVTAWIKTTQATGEVGLVNKYVAGSLNGWQVFLYNGSVRAWYFGNNANYIWDGGRGLNGGPVTNGAWHHIAFTVEDTGGRLYVDGVLKDSLPWTGTPTSATSTQEMRLGSYPGGGFYQGVMDEVAVWWRVQPASFIQTNMGRAYIGIEDWLMGYYRMNEGSGTYVGDLSNFEGSNSGTATNGPTYVPGVILRPGVLTTPGRRITESSAMLQGYASSDTTNCIGWFEWGTTTNYGNSTAAQTINFAVYGYAVPYTQNIAGLASGITYHYRAGASNSLGVSYSEDQSFFTTSTNMINARRFASATLLTDGKVLVAGGERPELFFGSQGTEQAPEAELFDPASSKWISTGSMTTGRIYHTATLLQNGKVLVVGGLNTDYTVLRSAELYDPVTHDWTPTGSLTTQRHRHTATLLQDGKVLVAGGGLDLSLSAIPSHAEIYDPNTGAWTQTFGNVGVRIDHTATLQADGRVLLAGGRVSSTVALATAELYNPATGASNPTLGNMATNHYSHTATLLPNGRTLVTGGRRTGASLVGIAELFDPNTGFWFTTTLPHNAQFDHTANMLPNGDVVTTGAFGPNNQVDVYENTTWLQFPGPGFEQGIAAILPTGKLLVAGGQGPNGLIPDAQLFDIFAGKWGTNNPLPLARELHTATLLTNGQVLVAGGCTNNSATIINRADVFNPVTGNWSITGFMTTNRNGHTATLLANGLVLVTGGSGLSVTHASAELYNPGTGLWAATGSMTTNRSHHTTTLLPDGKVLAAGGVSGGFGINKTADLFDPATGLWTATGVMPHNHYNHTATLLPNGKVLVAGGNEFLSAATNCELYDPATWTWTATGPLNVARAQHTATLLPNGKVLVASQGSSELYDPATETWTMSGAMTTNSTVHTATLLPNGEVLVAGGSFLSTVFSAAELYDPLTEKWAATTPLQIARYQHTATLLPNGKVLVAGGFGNTNFIDLANTELYDTGLNYSNSWRPQIASITSPLAPGATLNVTGSKFRGISEGSGGNGVQTSAGDHPIVQLRRLDNEQSVYLLSTNWSTNAITTAPVTGFPPGPAMATIYVNGIPSTGVLVSVSFPVPPVPVLTNSRVLPNGSFVLSFTNPPGGSYTALASSNATLPLSNWTMLGGVSEISPGQFQYIDPAATNNSQRFYRVRSP